MSKDSIKTVFIGTPDFGSKTLETLINNNIINVVSVISQPDKKVGRKQLLTPPPIKQIALKNDIPVLQPLKINTITKKIKDLKPDLIIVIAYAQIIPEDILNIPQYGCINVHASLLPKYRGAACIQASILNGDKKTGISVMKMDKGLDTGPIISKFKIDINDDDTTGNLFNKLSELSSNIIISTISDYIKGKIEPIPQDNTIASYVGQLSKKDGKIDWEQTAEKINLFIRAMSPWPGAYTFTQDDKLIKIIETEKIVLEIKKYKSGTIFIEANKLCIQCQNNAIIIKKIQPAGKKIMLADEFIRGYDKIINTILK